MVKTGMVNLQRKEAVRIVFSPYFGCYSCSDYGWNTCRWKVYYGINESSLSGWPMRQL